MPGELAMTPQEFAAKMQALYMEHSRDPEAFHGYADDLMCRVLRELGYSDGVRIFEAAEGWRA